MSKLLATRKQLLGEYIFKKCNAGKHVTNIELQERIDDLNGRYGELTVTDLIEKCKLKEGDEHELFEDYDYPEIKAFDMLESKYITKDVINSILKPFATRTSKRYLFSETEDGDVNMKEFEEFVDINDENTITFDYPPRNRYRLNIVGNALYEPELAITYDSDSLDDLYKVYDEVITQIYGRRPRNVQRISSPVLPYHIRNHQDIQETSNIKQYASLTPVIITHDGNIEDIWPTIHSYNM